MVAVGIPRALLSRDFAVLLTGYLIMRMAMVGLWLRAAVGGLLTVFSMWWLYFDMPTEQIVAWALHAPYKRPSVSRNWSVPVAVVLIMTSSATSQAVLVTGALLASLLALTLVFRVGRSSAVEGPAVETTG